MSRFSGKTVVITGASRGIGAALARRFAREGASVVVSANEPAAESVAADIVATGGKAQSSESGSQDHSSEFAPEFSD